MATPRFAKVDAQLDTHPKIEQAGFWGSVVYQLLLRINRANDFDGCIPSRYVTARHVASRLGLRDAIGISADPEVLAKAALIRCISAGLIRKDDDIYHIIGWDDEWRGAQSEAVRARKYRESKKKDRHAPSRTESDGCDASRSSRSREEKSREEKSSLNIVSPKGSPLTGSQTHAVDIEDEFAKVAEFLVPIAAIVEKAPVSPPKRRKKSGPDDALVSETARTVVKAFNQCMERNLGSKGSETQVKRLLKAGYSEPQMRAVMWWAGEEWGGDDEWRIKVTPTTMLKLTSSAGSRTFPQYLDLAAELWRESKRETPPWEIEA